ncbi:Glu/Leu/Phe/Val dehydrogenase dimerization domain-containing protein [Oceanibacterium hippocampi]|uniref:Leucine dehydrogenase n=1 Tax=Oceanibacterium hippocampi TaxID=745714 RepID=A0A1Y5SJZ4_9PROT|nr:Glu/Leu/Phe/Val dehydrogenase dimerization domain-containing protein [Oceanibacterium hippocampi]SLN41352.1 Leucine dehydrogenase [Oceanibacterium hippocampi]
MSVFSHPAFDNHEDVLFCHDRATGLKAIIAVHDTTLGPALGGTRMWPYANDGEALTDALRLSRGMTYKSALAGLDLGGGKSVIIGDPRREKSPALFRAFGDAVERLGGTYIAAEDVGTSVEDLEEARKSTRHIAGIGEGGAGDPSPATARGVFAGLRAAVRHRLGADDLRGIRVAIQGLGHVGMGLAGHLHAAGGSLVVADIFADNVAEAVERFGATAVDPATILFQDVDVVAPCALGAILNDQTIPRLKATVVAGAANNQLAEDCHGEALRARGVLYAPDYVINAGGIIFISHEGPRFDRDRAMAHVESIGETLTQIFVRSAREDVPTNRLADAMARERIVAARAARAPVALAG